MAAITTATNTTLFTTYLIKKFIETLDEFLVLGKLPRTDALPMNSGNEVRWNRFTKMAAVTTYLTEGTEPTTPTSVATTSRTTALKQAGDYIQLADMFEMTTMSGSMEGFTKRLAKQAALSVDGFIRTEAITTTTKQWERRGTTQSAFVATDTLSAGGLRVLAETFQTALAHPHPITGGKFYVLVTSPAASWDLQGESATGGWLDSVKAVTTGGLAPALQMDFASGPQGASNIWMGSPGVFAGIAIAVSQNINTATTTGSGGATFTAYQNLAFADDGMGMIAMKSNLTKPEIIIRRPGPQSVGQPLGMFMTMGWKINFATRLLEDAKVALVYSAI